MGQRAGHTDKGYGNREERRVGKGNSPHLRAPARVGRTGEQAGMRDKCRLSLDHCAYDVSGKGNRASLDSQDRDLCVCMETRV